MYQRDMLLFAVLSLKSDPVPGNVLIPQCLSYVFTIVANYISGRHNEDWYSVQTICCATLNNVPIFILEYVHTRGRDP